MPFSYIEQTETWTSIDVRQATEHDRMKIILEDGRIVMFRRESVDFAPDFLETDAPFLVVDCDRTSASILHSLFDSIREQHLLAILQCHTIFTRWARRLFVPSLRKIQANAWLEISLRYNVPVVGSDLCIHASPADDYDFGNWWRSETAIRSVEFITLP